MSSTHPATAAASSVYPGLHRTHHTGHIITSTKPFFVKRCERLYDTAQLLPYTLKGPRQRANGWTCARARTHTTHTSMIRDKPMMPALSSQTISEGLRMLLVADHEHSSAKRRLQSAGQTFHALSSYCKHAIGVTEDWQSAKRHTYGTRTLPPACVGRRAGGACHATSMRGGGGWPRLGDMEGICAGQAVDGGEGG